jgi:uncharacterized RDD family membrane protein YckC
MPQTSTPSPAAGRPAFAASAPGAEVTLASLGLRASAFLLDYILTMLIPAITVMLAVYFKRRWGALGLANFTLLLGYLTAAAWIIFNSVILCVRDGQTFGKRFIGIRILRLDGGPLDYRTAILRHLVGYPLGLLCFGFGFWWALWDRRQQGWHDKIAKTLVVKE